MTTHEAFQKKWSDHNQEYYGTEGTTIRWSWFKSGWNSALREHPPEMKIDPKEVSELRSRVSYLKAAYERAASELNKLKTDFQSQPYDKAFEESWRKFEAWGHGDQERPVRNYWFSLGWQARTNARLAEDAGGEGCGPAGATEAELKESS